MSKEDVVTYISPECDPDYRFTGLPLRLAQLSYKNWELVREVTYRTEVGELVTVREGFKFDFASVPRAFWWLYPPTGTKGNPYGIAALVHDWLLMHHKIGGRKITRKEADDIFLEIMLYTGCRKSLAYTLWTAVRANSMAHLGRWT